MPNIVEIVVRAKDLSKAGFAESEASARGFGESLKAIGELGAAGFAVVGYESVKMASSFQAQMTLLNTQAGVSQKQVASLSKGVLQLAGQVGFSPDSLAESLFHVESNFSSLGIKGPDALKLVKIAAEGAAVGHADLVDVTNALTAAVASGIPGVKNMSQAMGMLNAIVGAGDMKMQDLAEAFGSGMVATVKGFGLSLKDVGAALATFGDNNIRGAHAGTQLRMSVMALAAPTKYGTDLLKQWGEHTDQLARDMRSGGLLKALEDLEVHFKKSGITAKEQGEVITNMFGKKAGAGLNVLMDQLDRLRSKYPAISKGASDFGNAWETTKKQFAQQMKEIRGSIDVVMIRIGSALIPVIQKVFTALQSKTAAGIFKAIGDDVRILVKALEAAAPFAEKVGKALLAIAVPAVRDVFKVIGDTLRFLLGPMRDSTIAVLALLGGILLVNTAVNIARGIWGALNVVLDMNPWLAIGIAVAVLAGIIIKYHQQIWDFVVKIWHDITAVAVAAFKPIEEAVAAVVGWIESHWKFLLLILTGPIGLAVIWIADHWKTVQHDVDALIGWVKDHWRPNLFTAPVKAAVSWIGTAWSKVTNLFTAPVKAAVDTIEGWIRDIMHAIGGVVSFFSNLTSNNGFLGKALSFIGLEHGGIVGAASGGVRSGMVMVGERGRELVKLPAGSHVYNHGQTEGMLAGAGGGRGVVSVQLEWIGGQADGEFMTWLKKNVRIHGGDPTVLGR